MSLLRGNDCKRWRDGSTKFPNDTNGVSLPVFLSHPLLMHWRHGVACKRGTFVLDPPIPEGRSVDLPVRNINQETLNKTILTIQSWIMTEDYNIQDVNVVLTDPSTGNWYSVDLVLETNRNVPMLVCIMFPSTPSTRQQNTEDLDRSIEYVYEVRELAHGFYGFKAQVSLLKVGLNNRLIHYVTK